MITPLFMLLILFPETRHTSIDPSHRYEVSWREATNEQPHQLTFRKIPAGSKTLVRNFDRSVEVLWSPSGNSFLVTDHEGSDSSRVYVYNSSVPNTPHELRAELPTSVARALAESHHAYLPASKWLDDSAVLLRAHGYGDTQRRGFDVHVRCGRKDGVWFCVSLVR